MTTSLTIFKNLYDNKTDKRMDFSSFNELEKLLYKMAKIPRATKKDAPLISPATYIEGEKRRNINVINWAKWAAVDIDDHVFKGNLKDELLDRFGDKRFTCYSTASSRIDYPKYRLVCELDVAVEAERIRHFWFALNKDLGDISDGQCKDYSRMYFVPASYANAHNFIFSNRDASPISVSRLLAKHEYVGNTNTGNNFFDSLPKVMQDQIVEQRKNKLENDTYSWSSYRDCPFWPKRKAEDYLFITETGWYTAMYGIMVAIAGHAVAKEYPISSHEIAEMCQDFDRNHGNWYKNRAMLVEADRALDFIYRS
jgi:hypothetical protein